MHTRRSWLIGASIAALASSVAWAQPIAHATPTIYVAGDSTAANGDEAARGWGRPLAVFFDARKVQVENRARGGRSSRTFVTEGLWEGIRAHLRPGDVVLIQFGHNDGGAVNDDQRARGSLPGLGEETQEIDNLITHQHEVVRTYGWYMRKMISETRAQGALPVVLSLTVRNIWDASGHVERGPGQYGEWSRQLAEAERVPFIDLTNLIADEYERMGQAAVAPLFPRDHTHTNNTGALINARFVVEGLKALHERKWRGWFSDDGKAVEPAASTYVMEPPRRG